MRLDLAAGQNWKCEKQPSQQSKIKAFLSMSLAQLTLLQVTIFLSPLVVFFFCTYIVHSFQKGSYLLSARQCEQEKLPGN